MEKTINLMVVCINSAALKTELKYLLVVINIKKTATMKY